MLSTILDGQFELQQFSDWIIAIAYFSIPLQLIYFLYKFPIPLDRTHKFIIGLFAAFILACGLTHAFHALEMIFVRHYLTGHPFASNAEVYSSSTVFSLSQILLWSKIFTALVSIFTCLTLIFLIPVVLAGVRYLYELEEEMRTKMVELDEARDTAETANVRKGQFMAYLCHEIRNPLHIITANIDFLIESSQQQLENYPSVSGDPLKPFDREVTATSTVDTENDYAASERTTVSPSKPFPPPRHISPSRLSPARILSPSQMQTQLVLHQMNAAANSQLPPLATPHSGSSGQSLLFNIPSIPNSTAHSREPSQLPDPLTTAFNTLLPLDTLHVDSVTQLTRGASSFDSDDSSTSSASGIANNEKRRTWPLAQMLQTQTSKTGNSSGTAGRSTGSTSSLQSPRLSAASGSPQVPPTIPTNLGALNEEQRQYLRTINCAAELMVSICNDVLDIAKLESGVIHFAHVPVDLASLCETFVSLCKPQAQAKNIKLSLHMDESPLPNRFVYCDPTRLHQVFLQLISNSIKFAYLEGDTPPVHKDGQIPPPTPLSISSNIVDTNAETALVASSPPPAFPPRLTSDQAGGGGQIQFRVRCVPPPPHLSAQADEDRAQISSREAKEAAARKKRRMKRQQQLPLFASFGSPSSEQSSATDSSASPELINTPLPPLSAPVGTRATAFTALSPGSRRNQGPPHSFAQNPSQPFAASTGSNYGTRASAEPSRSSSATNYDSMDCDEENSESKQLIAVDNSSTDAAVVPNAAATSNAVASSSLSINADARVYLPPVTSLMRSRSPFSPIFDGYQQSHPVDTEVSASPSPRYRKDSKDAAEYMWVEFSICDNGIGMSPQSLRNVFVAYNDNKLKTYRSRGGTGLGLSIASEVVRQLGGEIVATSLEGEGSIFTITLRFEIAPEEQVLEAGKSGATRALQENLDEQLARQQRSSAMTAQHFFPQQPAPTSTSSARGPPPAALYDQMGMSRSSSASSSTSSRSSTSRRSTAPLGFSIGPSQPHALSLREAHTPPTKTSSRSSPNTVNSNAYSAAFDEPRSVDATASKEQSPTKSASSDAAPVTPAVTLAALHVPGLEIGGPAPLHPPPSELQPHALPTLPTSAMLGPVVSASGSSTATHSPNSSLTPTPPLYPAVAPGSASHSLAPSPIQAHASLPTFPHTQGSPSTSHHAPMHHYRLLVVDDNEINRKLLSRMMHSLSYQVDTAADGLLAVEAVKKNLEEVAKLKSELDDIPASEAEARVQKIDEIERVQYCMIIMDISMPVMDGYESTRAIRAMGLTLPIIALTANAMTEEKSKAFDAGCNEFCTKPIRKHELVTLMRHFCGHLLEGHDGVTVSTAVPASAANSGGGGSARSSATPSPLYSGSPASYPHVTANSGSHPSINASPKQHSLQPPSGSQTPRRTSFSKDKPPFPALPPAIQQKRSASLGLNFSSHPPVSPHVPTALLAYPSSFAASDVSNSAPALLDAAGDSPVSTDSARLPTIPSERTFPGTSP